MMQLPIPLAKEVVLVGGGHSHALFLRRWGMKPVPGARLTVINPAPTAPYTGMLPGYVAGHYRREELEIDLVRLARFADARLIFGWVEAIDPEARTVTVAGRPPIPFHFASIDIGVTSDMPEIPGFPEHGVAAKPLGSFALRWRAFLDGGGGDVAVIGAGVAGVELALTMHHALAGRGTVTLIEAKTALTGIAPSARKKLLDRMESDGIRLIENASVASVSADGVALDSGDRFDARLTVGAAGARPFPWLADTGLHLTDGYITVDESLRSRSHPHVFAAGDCAHIAHAPRAKAGVFAVRAAPVLVANIRAGLTGQGLTRFRPQAHYLKLISLGPKAALADKWGMSAAGKWAWTWKDRIDRAFMDKLNNPPPMKRARLPANVALGVAEALGPKPLCGGCGAKVGSGTLEAALRAFSAIERNDVETIPGDDAAILKVGEVRQAISTDHLRSFWNDPWLMARIAAVHALNDILAMGAEPQAALAQITLPPMSEPMQAAWLDDILDGAGGLFAEERVAIVGGHTSIGSELTIGFTVTGIAADRSPRLDGAREGDVLILTHPLGSGTVLAAEMEGMARGDDVACVLKGLVISRGHAARLLAAKAHAMTDVTGFGLAGHLSKISKASGLSAEIRLADLPLYPGTEELAAQGIRSSIWPQNRAAVEATVPETARAALLFDPQTAGGFLAAVAPEEAGAVLADLASTGTEARIIGQMKTKGSVTLSAR